MLKHEEVYFFAKMSKSTGNEKKRKKSYYIQASKKGNRLELATGMKGFFITCNFNERDCVRDAYNLLNEFAVKLYGPEKAIEEVKEDEDDVEKMLEREVNSLKAEKPTERRFQSVDTRSRNCIFIKTQLENPTEIVDTIIAEILESHRQCSRYILRMLPIEVTCKPTLQDICKSAEPLLQSSFKYIENSSEKQKTFAIVFKARNNGSVRRDEVIGELAKIIHKENENCKADLNTPDQSVIVEIVCKICCIGVVKNYTKLQKYNLAEISNGSKVSVGKAVVSEEKPKEMAEECKNDDQ